MIKTRMSLPEDTSRDVSFKGDLSTTKLKDTSNACDSNDHQQQKEMDTIAHVFYQRVQNETEEFLQQIAKYVLPPNDSKESHRLKSYEDDHTLLKMKLLLMIHTTCSNITNLLVHCS